MTIVNPDDNLNLSAKNSANVNAETIYSLIIGDNATVNQQIIQQQRKRRLFQLAEDSPDFTGRSQETETIEKILKGDSPTAMISVVSGMGGVGKSMLARHVGNRLKAQFPDGQLYVDLLGQSDTCRSADSVLVEFLVDGFGEDPQHLPFELDALRKLFHDRLSGCKILVVLDNAGDALQVEPLLPRVRGCGAIVTSREPLMNLAGMTAENFVSLDVMTEGEATELVQRLCPKKTVDVGLVKLLVGLCGRLPLALTIVGKLLLQTASLTLVEVMAELSKERSRLRALKYVGSDNQVDARLDVEASFNLSYVRLNESQRGLFEAVALLRGRDFGRELAAVMVGREEAEVRRELDQLVALQLVQWEVGRYGFHDLVREFGRGKLGAEREQALTEVALGWYVAMADQMKKLLLTDESVAVKMAIQQFESEWQNLLQAITWSSEIKENSSAIKLFQDVQYYASLRGFRTQQLLEVGFQTLTTAQLIGDRVGEANTLKAIGDVLQFLDQRQDALNRYETAMEIYRQVGSRLGEANTLKEIGDVLQFLDQRQDALNRYETAMEIYRQVGDRLGEANTLDSFALANFSGENYLKAIECHQQALDIFTLIESRYDIAWSLRYLGKVHLKLGDSWKAKEFFEKAATLFEALEMDDSAQACQQEIKNLNPNIVPGTLPKAPNISDDLTPRKKKPQFPLWQSAIVLLVLGIGWLAIKPHAPAPQNGEVRQAK